MLTNTQKEWINHLSDEDKIKIVPFDPKARAEFEEVKLLIQSKLGPTVRVEHRGASGFGISGQNEIDIYVPVPESDFDDFVGHISKLFGTPRSYYPLERARFVASRIGKRIDVHLMNENRAGWLNCERFEAYLRTHPEALEEYRLLKESGDGISTREYYRKKLEFINEILERI